MRALSHSGSIVILIDMLVKEIMNRNVITVGENETLHEAIRLMNDNHVGCLVVLMNSIPVGMLTERDILRAFDRSVYVNIDNLLVGDVMTHWLVTIEPDRTVEDAIKTMNKNRIRRLPVVYKEKLVGILTITDIMSAAPDLCSKIRKK